MIGQRVQYWIWMITGLMVLIVLGKVVIAPQKGSSSELAKFEFPHTVPLTGWQARGSGGVKDQPSDRRIQKRLLANKLYQYQHNSLPLQIEMRYTLETSGNVIGFLSNYTTIPSAVIQPALRDERYRPGVGYYLLFVHQQRAYLTSCINPKGGSTVSLPQFRRNRYAHDLQGDRLLKWLVYGDGIRDDRCLWVNMSMPLDRLPLDQTRANGTKTAYTALEQAWFPWFDWWQTRFPQS